jgi:uncharacterized protein YqjF (DUF2071 family)
LGQSVKVIGYQRWDSLLFLHWPVPQGVLRPLVPERLAVDTFEGRAYVSITPFTVVGARLIMMPRLPGLSTFHELNVRTYVRFAEDPGIWFFSLDAASPLAALLARISVRLPYYFAYFERHRVGNKFRYRCDRYKTGLAAGATLSASWEVSPEVRRAEPGSLDYFLSERYALFSRAIGRKLWHGRVRHAPWPLQAVHNLQVEQTMDLADGLPRLGGEVAARYSAGVEVEFLPFRLV